LNREYEEFKEFEEYKEPQVSVVSAAGELLSASSQASFSGRVSFDGLGVGNEKAGDILEERLCSRRS
jgi:hypothetical protein